MPSRRKPPTLNRSRLGIIAETAAISGVAIPNGAAIAADAINAAGGVNGRKIELINYDDHSSSAEAVRAYQRAVNQDHVVAVVATYTSEVALALEPWAARLKVPFHHAGGCEQRTISKHVHDDYDHNKYTFHEWLNSAFIAQSVCDFTHDILVPDFKIKTAVVLERGRRVDDAARCRLHRLPAEGRRARCWTTSASRRTPRISRRCSTRSRASGRTSSCKGSAMSACSRTGQWHAQQVPIPMAGDSSQATTSTFWKDTNGAADGVITESASAPGVSITPKTAPFTDAYIKRFGASPGYAAYTTDDSIYRHREPLRSDPEPQRRACGPGSVRRSAPRNDGVRGRCQFAACCSGIFTNEGNTSLPLACSCGQTVTCLPFCHCTITPVM